MVSIGKKIQGKTVAFITVLTTMKRPKKQKNNNKMKQDNLVYYCIILYYSITFPSSYAVATAENFKFQKKRGALVFDEKSQHMLLYRSADA